jgi:hypothetical protein
MYERRFHSRAAVVTGVAAGAGLSVARRDHQELCGGCDRPAFVYLGLRETWMEEADS